MLAAPNRIVTRLVGSLPRAKGRGSRKSGFAHSPIPIPHSRLHYSIPSFFSL